MGSEKLFGVKFPAGEPEGPQGEQDFALGVQPRMGGGTGVAQGKLMEVPDGTRAAFGGLEIGAIADGLQGADALAVELLIAKGLVITGAVADAEAAIAGEAGEFAEPFWVLDVGDKEMRPNQTDPWGCAQTLDLGELAAGLAHEPAELGLTGEGLI